MKERDNPVKFTKINNSWSLLLKLYFKSYKTIVVFSATPFPEDGTGKQDDCYLAAGRFRVIFHSMAFFFITVALSATTQAQTLRHLESSNIQSPNLLAWRNAEVRAVVPEDAAHSIHSYFTTNPESPDGRHVLYFHSETPNGESGDIRMIDRKNGSVRTLRTGISAEDAHRAACQQWVAGGQAVAYHDFRDGRWIVAVTNIATGQERILVRDRQIGFGTASSPWVPLYGPHWKQGLHRDLELVHVITGEIRKVLTMDTVLAKYGREVNRLVGEGDVSIFFPVLSPDANSVMFKVARGNGSENFRSSNASNRKGKFVFDITNRRFIRFYELWGHPAWMPNSRDILEKGSLVFFPETNDSIQVSEVPNDHPSAAPNGSFFTSDSHTYYADSEGRRPEEWAVFVTEIETGEYLSIYRFLNNKGALSWRVPHPHPVFSADGRRIYFNVSKDGFTRLYVASLPEDSSALSK